jgi:hypothetical protein
MADGGSVNRAAAKPCAASTVKHAWQAYRNGNLMPLRSQPELIPAVAPCRATLHLFHSPRNFWGRQQKAASTDGAWRRSPSSLMPEARPSSRLTDAPAIRLLSRTLGWMMRPQWSGRRCRHRRPIAPAFTILTDAADACAGVAGRTRAKTA